jgi:replicative DNA helicase
MQVTGKIPTTAQAGYFIEKVREKHLLRELIKAATGAVEQAYGFTGGTRGVRRQGRAGDLRGHAGPRERQRPADEGADPEANNVIAKMLMKKGELTGVTSGFKDLDAITFGFQRQEMIVLAARPSMGKTSLALNIAEAAALPKSGKGEPVATLIFSLEMSASQLALRMLCSRARVNMKLLRDGLVSKNGDEQRPRQAADEFKKAPIYIDDSSNLTIMELRAKARRIHARQQAGFHHCGLPAVDCPTDPGPPRTAGRRGLPRIKGAGEGTRRAGSCPKPAQPLFRKGEPHSPKLSDLRESGSIEQDADVVLMLARPKDADEKFQVRR